jgi:hypothetical protein
LGAHVSRDDKLSQIAQICVYAKNLTQLGNDLEQNFYHAVL